MFDVQKFVSMITIAVEKHDQERKKFEDEYINMASPAQLEKIKKANKLGWYVSMFCPDDNDKRVLLRNNRNKAEMVIDFYGNVGR